MVQRGANINHEERSYYASNGRSALEWGAATMTIKGLQKRLHVDGSHVWYIDKRVKRYGRLCEGTGTDNREEAERYLLHRLHELREVLIYGRKTDPNLPRCDSKIREHLREKEIHKT